MTPAEALSTMRESAGLSQSELARRLDTAPSAVSRSERPESTPTITTLARVARETARSVVILIDAQGDVSATVLAP